MRVERGVVEVRSAGPGRRDRARGGRPELVAGHPDGRARLPSETPPPATARSRGAARRGRPGAARAVPAPARGAARVALAARDTDAKELFEQARRLWRDGHIREAADAYQALLSSHPRDPRAGLAAFELGRLRMDRLGDMPGAVQALERAVALAPGAELREDAMARLVARAPARTIGPGASGRETSTSASTRPACTGERSPPPAPRAERAAGAPSARPQHEVAAIDRGIGGELVGAVRPHAPDRVVRPCARR